MLTCNVICSCYRKLFVREFSSDSSYNIVLQVGHITEEMITEMILTLNIILNRTCELMGNNFTIYSSCDNNCSDFVIALIKANRIAISANITFVD